MSIPLTFTRDELLARLRSMLPAAKKADAKALIAHRKEEAAYLKRFHAACREALSWDYKKAARHDFEAKVLQRGDRTWKQSSPSCPVAGVDKIERCIAFVNTSASKTFRLNERGKYHHIYAVLTAHIDDPKGMC